VSGRLICLVLIVPLLLQTGCFKTVSTFRPGLHQDPDPSLPCDVKVTLRSEIVLYGKHSVFPWRVNWRTKKISGKLVAWNDEMVSIHVRNIRDKDFEIPIEDILKIEITPIDKIPRPCLFAGGCLLGAAPAVAVLATLGYLFLE